MNLVPLTRDAYCLSSKIVAPYEPHVSLDYKFALVSGGRKKFTCRRLTSLAGASSILLAQPGEAHEGRPVDDSYHLNMLNISPAFFSSVAASGQRAKPAPPSFKLAVAESPEIAIYLHRFFNDVASVDRIKWALFIEEELHSIISKVIQRFGGPAIDEMETREKGAVLRAHKLIHDLFDASLSLEQLSAESRLPKFRFLRAFKREFGMAPHAFQLQLRVEKAKRMMVRGASVADASAACGFFDQSHFSRHFNRIEGISPGKFRSAVFSRQRARTYNLFSR